MAKRNVRGYHRPKGGAKLPATPRRRPVSTVVPVTPPAVPAFLRGFLLFNVPIHFQTPRRTRLIGPIFVVETIEWRNKQAMVIRRFTKDGKIVKTIEKPGGKEAGERWLNENGVFSVLSGYARWVPGARNPILNVLHAGKRKTILMKGGQEKYLEKSIAKIQTGDLMVSEEGNLKPRPATENEGALFLAAIREHPRTI